MITPRSTRLLRVPGLRAFQRAIADAVPSGWDARTCAVLVPTRSAAEELRRTLEEVSERAGQATFVFPDLLTRGELYVRLHERSPDLPPLLTDFERDVLLRLAAEDAEREGAEAPFRLRPGLVTAILSFYDELRRRMRTIDSFDRHVRERLEAGSDTDRGAARLLKQTLFLAGTFAAFERRVADSGALDEHALRTLALAGALPSCYRRIIVAVADEAAEPRGLWPADFDLLSRIAGLTHLDIVSTERMLAGGFHQRLHDALPGLHEERAGGEEPAPVLVIPEPAAGREPTTHFVARDREEELMDAARWLKGRARNAGPRTASPLDRTAFVFQRPLPYLYLGQQVLGSAGLPYRALDALPLAAEPFAAAVDLLLAVVAEEPTRTSLVDLLASPFWRLCDPGAAGRPLSRQAVASLDRVLQDAKYLGGWEPLARLAAGAEARVNAGGRDGRHWSRARPALAAAVAAGEALAAVRQGDRASAQVSALLAFIMAHEQMDWTSPHAPDEGTGEPAAGEPFDAARARHMRARGAVLGALAALRDAHARHDDRPVPLPELAATLRRWIEGHTFSPRAGREGVLLADAPAAAFASVDSVRILGLVETDWPERTTPGIFYPATLLRGLGWPADTERLAAARARFQDLLLLAGDEVSLSSFTLEEDALVAASPFLEDVASAGLAVRRVEPDATRIFVHEALMGDPPPAGALPQVAARWLDLRQARTPQADPRFHGTIGARDGTTYAVSRVERYLECPFKYFAGHILQVEEERDDESGLTPRERGQLLHGVFEAFFAAWQDRGRVAIDSGNIGEAVALFEEVAEAHLALLPEADRGLERTYLLGSAVAPGLAERAFAVDIEGEVPAVERLLEYEFDGPFRFEGAEGSRTVHVRGKADRIDLLPDGSLRVVDYKLGRAPKPARALQLPIYGICAAQQLEAARGRPFPVGRAGYVAFREKNTFVDLGGRSGNLEGALREGQLRFLTAIDGIESGVFPPDPEEPWLCSRCGFSHVCRKDYVGDE